MGIEIVSLPMKMVIFHSSVGLPEGKSQQIACHPSHSISDNLDLWSTPKITWKHQSKWISHWGTNTDDNGNGSTNIRGLIMVYGKY